VTTVDFPKLRLLDSQWSEQDGQPVLVVRDRLGLTGQIAILPPVIAVLLGLFDGSRDLEAIRAAFALRTGTSIGRRQLEDIVAQLDGALLLESPRFEEIRVAALAEFRSAPARPMSLAGQVYPIDAEDCERQLGGYGVSGGMDPAGSADSVRCVICPHIDYQRGGHVYYRTWHRALRAAEEAEVVVLFGTDHFGGTGSFTLTRQSYQTPFGVLPTDLAAVDAVVRAIGEDVAYREELHHRGEHSIELGSVWLSYAADGRPIPMVPVLCGSFHRLVEGPAQEERERLDRAIAALAGAVAGRRVLVVAAADLAHVGPDFGDEAAFGRSQKAELEGRDARLLDRVVDLDPEGFLEEVREVGDRFRVCGLPPIYLALRLVRELAEVSAQGRGEVVAYDQCPTPSANGSWVSVAGALVR